MRRNTNMERVRIKNPPRFIPWIYELVAIIAIVISLVATVVFGSADITWSTMTQVIPHRLFRIEPGESVPASSDTIIWNLHAPRGTLAAVIGAGLAVLGAAIQTLVHNPLADPYLLGASTGAGADATAVIVFGAFSKNPIASLIFGAFLGAVMATLAVSAFATADDRLTPLRLVLSGIVLSAVLSTLSSFMVFAGPDPRIAQSVMLWMLGSVAGAAWVKALFPFIVLIVVLLFFLVRARQLDALATGKNAAVTVDVSITRLHTQVFVLQVILVGTLVVISGNIGFIGLMIPRLTCILVGTTHRVILPVAAFMSGLFLIWMDIITHVVSGSQEVPLGAVTGLVGTPLSLYLMNRSHYSYGGAE